MRSYIASEEIMLHDRMSEALIVYFEFLVEFYLNHLVKLLVPIYFPSLIQYSLLYL